MTFFLKKMISMFLMPLPLTLILLFLGFYFLLKDKIKQAKITFLSAFVFLFLISYPPLVNYLLYHLENTYPTLHQAPKNIHAIYVLGGGHEEDESQPISSQIHPSSLIRLNEGIRLYHQLENAKLIVSGYAGLFGSTSHAKMQEKLALSLGIPQSDIILIENPRDTQEEAQEAQKYLGESPFILVTSASHIKRAMGFFEQQKLTPLPAPSNHLASIKNPSYFTFFSIHTLVKARIIFHESLGILWQNWVRKVNNLN